MLSAVGQQRAFRNLMMMLLLFFAVPEATLSDVRHNQIRKTLHDTELQKTLQSASSILSAGDVESARRILSRALSAAPSSCVLQINVGCDADGYSILVDRTVSLVSLESSVSILTYLMKRASASNVSPHERLGLLLRTLGESMMTRSNGVSHDAGARLMVTAARLNVQRAGIWQNTLSAYYLQREKFSKARVYLSKFVENAARESRSHACGIADDTTVVAITHLLFSLSQLLDFQRYSRLHTLTVKAIHCLIESHNTSYFAGIAPGFAVQLQLDSNFLKHISSHWFGMLGVSREDSVSTSNGRGVSQADGTRLRVGILAGGFMDRGADLTFQLLKPVLKGLSVHFDIVCLRWTAGVTDARVSNKLYAFDWCANGPVSVNTTSGRYIEDMRLDVLIDVVGAGNLGNVPLLKRVRLSNSSRPLLLHWHAHPGGTGGAVDAILCDPTSCSSDLSSQNFVERVFLLPDTYYSTSHAHETTEKVSVNRTDFGLPKDAVVLCCHSQLWKVNEAQLLSWFGFLNRHKSAVLWLMIWHSDTVPVIRKHALKHGVWNKVVLTQPIQRKFQFAAKALCDVSLDTWSFGGHTSTTDWLWAGVPVVTYAGTGMHQRVSASLLLSRFYRHKDQRVSCSHAVVSRTEEDYSGVVDTMVRNAKVRRTLRSCVAHRVTPDLPPFNTNGKVVYVVAAVRMALDLYRTMDELRFHIVVSQECELM